MCLRVVVDDGGFVLVGWCLDVGLRLRLWLVDVGLGLGLRSSGSGSGSGLGAGFAGLGRRAMPPDIATVRAPMPANHRKIAGPKVVWSTPTSPKLPSRPLPAYASSAMATAATAAATVTLASADTSGTGRSAHCCPTATPDAAATMSSATHTGPSGGDGSAASTGSAGMSPPNTVNELNVASPTWALEPTATAAVPTSTLGT